VVPPHLSTLRHCRRNEKGKSERREKEESMENPAYISTANVKFEVIPSIEGTRRSFQARSIET